MSEEQRCMVGVWRIGTSGMQRNANPLSTYPSISFTSHSFLSSAPSPSPYCTRGNVVVIGVVIIIQLYLVIDMKSSATNDAPIDGL